MIKALEIKTSMLFSFGFADKTTFSYFFFFLLVIDSYFLITAGIAQIFNPIAELAISIGIPSEKAKAEFEIHPVTVEAEIRKKFNII